MEEIGSAAMLATKMSAGVAPEVNLRQSVTYTPTLIAIKSAHSGFETQRITGVSVVPKIKKN